MKISIKKNEENLQKTGSKPSVNRSKSNSKNGQVNEEEEKKQDTKPNKTAAKGTSTSDRQLRKRKADTQEEITPPKIKSAQAKKTPLDITINIGNTREEAKNNNYYFL